MISLEAHRASIGLHNLCRRGPKKLQVNKTRWRKRTMFSMGDLSHIKTFWLVFQLLFISSNPNQSSNTKVPTFVKTKPKYCMLLLSLLYLFVLLLLHGDVENNPGPTSTSKPNNSQYLSTYFLNARSLKTLSSTKINLGSSRNLSTLSNPA